MSFANIGSPLQNIPGRDPHVNKKSRTALNARCILNIIFICYGDYEHLLTDYLHGRIKNDDGVRERVVGEIEWTVDMRTYPFPENNIEYRIYN